MSNSQQNTGSNSRRRSIEEIRVTIELDEARKEQLIGQLQAFFLEQQRLEDLDGEVYEPEGL